MNADASSHKDAFANKVEQASMMFDQNQQASSSSDKLSSGEPSPLVTINPESLDFGRQ